MNFNDVIQEIKKVLKYEHQMEIDVKFLTKLTGWYSIILAILGIQSFISSLPYLTVFSFFISIFVFILSILAKKAKNIHVLRSVVIVISVFLFMMIILGACFGVNEGFVNFWSFMACNVILFVFGIQFGIIYSGSQLLFFIILLKTPFGSELRNSVISLFNVLFTQKTGVQVKQQFFVYSDSYSNLFLICFILWFVLILFCDFFLRINQIRQNEVEEQLETDLAKAMEEVEQTIFEGFSSIVRIIDEKDEYTKQHSLRVAKNSRLIAKEYGITDNDKLEEIYRIALLHDIGKIAVPDSILKKNKNLSDDEFEIMKKHTIWGNMILENLKFLPNAGVGAIYHHEKLNGTGYPAGKSGDEIPFIAKIITIADSLDAMNSNRVYREHCSKDHILNELRSFSNVQFEPVLVELVIKMIQDGKIEIEE